VRNGDFEQALAATWNVASNHAASAVSTAIKHSGNASLHLIANRGGRDEDTAVWQDTEPLTPGRTYTLSYWYLPSTNGVDLTVGLADQSLVSQHSIQPDKMATPGAANDNPATAAEVYINEWMAANSKTLADPADRKFSDWFELFNPGPQPVDLSGYSLSDDPTNTAKCRIPAGTMIGVNGFLVVWADQDTQQNGQNADLHVNFKLSQTGEFIGLYAPDGALVDSVSFGAQTVDASQGRWPDGQEGAFYSMATPSPGKPNVVAPIGPHPLRITGLRRLTGSTVTLTWESEGGQYYQVQCKNSLTDPTWADLGLPVRAEGGSASLTDEISGLPGLRIYRVLLVK